VGIRDKVKIEYDAGGMPKAQSARVENEPSAVLPPPEGWLRKDKRKPTRPPPGMPAPPPELASEDGLKRIERRLERVEGLLLELVAALVSQGREPEREPTHRNVSGAKVPVTFPHRCPYCGANFHDQDGSGFEKECHACQ
jgi:hypothetical protein